MDANRIDEQLARSKTWVMATAGDEGRIDTIDFLMSRGVAPDDTVWMFAANRGHIHVLEHLLKIQGQVPNNKVRFRWKHTVEERSDVSERRPSHPQPIRWRSRGS